jgi:hypothetical protein
LADDARDDDDGNNTHSAGKGKAKVIEPKLRKTTDSDQDFGH